MHVNDTGAPQTSVEGVLHAFTRIGRRLKARQPGDTLDHSAHLVMFALRCTGPARLSDLAARLEVDASTASRHIRSMEQAGLVRRSPDPDDGRAFRIELTEAGTTAYEAGFRRRQRLLTLAMEGWDREDVETFETLMTRFAEGVTNVPEEQIDPGDEATAPPQTTEQNVENS